MEPKIRFHSLIINVCLLSLWIFLQGESQNPAQEREDCGDRTCAEVFAQIQANFPHPMAKLQADCPAPSTLKLSVFQNEEEGERASFICWNELNLDDGRTGSWLGILPLDAEDITFAKPWICSKYDENCQEILPQLRSQFSQEIQAAEFQCAMKNGSLFISDSTSEIEVRCGFFATTIWDDNNDGIYDGEDPVSVDISLGEFRLESAQ